MVVRVGHPGSAQTRIVTSDVFPSHGWWLTLWAMSTQGKQSAQARERQGATGGVIGVLMAGFGWYTQVYEIMALGVLMAVIGGLVWVAGMARSDR